MRQAGAPLCRVSLLHINSSAVGVNTGCSTNGGADAPAAIGQVTNALGINEAIGSAVTALFARNGHRRRLPPGGCSARGLLSS